MQTKIHHDRYQLSYNYHLVLLKGYLVCTFLVQIAIDKYCNCENPNSWFQFFKNLNIVNDSWAINIFYLAQKSAVFLDTSPTSFVVSFSNLSIKRSALLRYPLKLNIQFLELMVMKWNDLDDHLSRTRIYFNFKNTFLWYYSHNLLWILFSLKNY